VIGLNVSQKYTAWILLLSLAGLPPFKALASEQAEELRFRFVPDESCGSALTYSSPFALLSSSFLAIRDHFNPKPKSTSTASKLLSVFSFKKKEAAPADRVVPAQSKELSVRAQDFLERRRDVVLRLLDHIRDAGVEDPTKIPTYEAFVAEIQWRLFIGKSLLNGREFYLIYVGALPEDRRLEFEKHKENFVVMIPPPEGSPASERETVVPLSDFKGLLSAEEVTQVNKPFRLDRHDEFFKYVEHFVTSHGWMFRLETELRVQRGWMLKTVSKESVLRGAVVNPYDLRGILAAGAGANMSLADIWGKLGSMQSRVSFFDEMERRQSLESFLAEIAGDPEDLPVSFGTQYFSLIAKFSIEHLAVLEPEKFRLLLADADKYLTALSQDRMNREYMLETFGKFLNFVQENQGYIEAQLTSVNRMVSYGEKLHSDFSMIVRKMNERADSYEQENAQLDVKSMEIVALERRVNAVQTLRAKALMFHDSLNSLAIQLQQLRIQAGEYRSFFRGVEIFIQGFPSKILNPESRLLLQEVETLRQARQKLE
jgi:hypothetical protein